MLLQKQSINKCTTKQLLQQFEHTLSIDSIGKIFEPVAHVKDLETTQHSLSSCIAKLCQIKRVKNTYNNTTLISIINALVMSKFTIAHQYGVIHPKRTSRKPS